MKLSKALVTGATGHLGSVLCRALLRAGVDVVAFARPTSPLTALEGLEVRVVRGDVLDRASLVRAAEGCDVVFHNAAVFDLHPRDPEHLSRVAIEGARSAVLAAAGARARLVFTSSVSAVGLGDSPSELLDEDTWAEHLTVPYYRAKQESERLALAAAAEHGVDLVRVLPTLVLGPGDHRVTPSSRLLLDMLRGRGATIDGGTNVIDVRDVATAMIAAAERGRSGGRYILGGENLLVRQIGEIVTRITGQRVPHVGVPRWLAYGIAAGIEAGAAVLGRAPALSRAIVRDVFGRYAFYDVSRARGDLGLTTRPLEETIRDAAAFLAG
jgi:dihydroflavonol-4-reductase